MTKIRSNEYVHYELNQEFTAIGGHYVVTKEVRLPFAGREVLYTTGYGVVDTSCCGTGGCGFALVYGYIAAWRGKRNDDGLAVTKAEPIRDEAVEKELRVLINGRETVTQINFM